VRLPIPPLRLIRKDCGGATQTRTGGKAFAELCLTTWLWRLSEKLERKTGFEPATLALARRCSTTEPLPHIRTGDLGIEPRNDGVKVRCLTAWLIPNMLVKKMGRSTGLEPANAGSTNQCVNPFATTATLFNWQGQQELNPHQRFWRPLFYL
jgi:hypothetical protein